MLICLVHAISSRWGSVTIDVSTYRDDGKHRFLGDPSGSGDTKEKARPTDIILARIRRGGFRRRAKPARRLPCHGDDAGIGKQALRSTDN